MRHFPGILIFVTLMAYAANARIVNSGCSTFPSGLQTIVNNNDYSQAIQLLKSYRDRQIKLKPQELMQSVRTVLLSSVARLRNHSGTNGDIGATLNSIVLDVGLILRALAQGNIDGIVIGALKGVVDGLTVGLTTLLGRLSNGLGDGNPIRGLLGGLLGGLSEGSEESLIQGIKAGKF